MSDTASILATPAPGDTGAPGGQQTTGSTAPAGTGDATGDTGANGATPPQTPQASDAGKKPDAPPTEPGKPETPPAADIELKFPEGVKTDAKLVDAFKALAKEAGLKSEGAQKIADLFVQSQKEAEAKFSQDYGQQLAKWTQEVESDKDIGGANLKPSMVAAQKAIARFGTPGLSELLKDPTIGSHPAMVRFVVQVGRALAEDKVSGGGSDGSPQDKTLAQLLYSDSK